MYLIFIDNLDIVNWTDVFALTDTLTPRHQPQATTCYTGPLSGCPTAKNFKSLVTAANPIRSHNPKFDLINSHTVRQSQDSYPFILD